MRVRSWAAIAMLLAAPAVSRAPWAQPAPRGAEVILAPPSLPPNLPPGLSIPGLQGGAASDVLQRILDAAGGRPAPTPVIAAPPVVVPAPVPSPAPAQGAPRADPGDPLSGSEAFFAARLPDAPPLCQFGYDTFRVEGDGSR